MPVIGEVRVASDSDFLALVSDDWAAVTADSSAVSCAVLVDDELWSADSLASAESSEAWAWSTWAVSEAVSTVARVWPAVTLWPTVTSTAFTRPETGKLRFSVSAAAMVPVAEAVCWMVP